MFKQVFGVVVTGAAVCAFAGCEANIVDRDGGPPAVIHEVHKSPDINVHESPDINVHKSPDINVQETPDINVQKSPDINVTQPPDVNINTPAPDINVTPQEPKPQSQP
jgi:hypothetical protein